MNLRNAKEYFQEHLAVGDYYSQSRSVAGEWLGKGAGALGLSGKVKADDFVSLCDNLNPRTGQKLTVRRKTTRIKRHEDGTTSEVANRRVFFDWAISPPKSVSIVALVGGDERTLRAHDEAVRLAVRELETFARTRVRRGGASGDRETGNLAMAVFRHETSRALDPHLHSHCIVFNATHDPVECRWKALEAREMHEARKYVECVYYHEMARALRRCGYEIENRPAGDFVVVGVPEELSRKFSKRDAEIDERLRKLLEERPGLAGRNVAEIRSHLAHDRRARKIPHADPKALRDDWHGQMTWQERRSLRSLCGRKERVRPLPIDEDAALSWAEEHVFDRRSVVGEQELWRHALEYGCGCDFSVDDLHAATRRTPYIRDKQTVTTRAVLGREYQLVEEAREGRGAAGALVPGWDGDSSLDEFQLAAARQLLGSHDRIMLFRGGAGTGKSFTLRVVHDALLRQGHAVHVLAPQRQQVEGLADDGMAGARTVSEFLMRKEMERNAVVMVDEAGQIGAKQMLDLVKLVRRHGGRLLLSGDTRQHGPVEASDALLAMEKYGRLRPAELNAIRRQDPKRARDKAERKRIAAYRAAVDDASEGDITGSFDRLDAMGAVVECSADDQQTELARHFLELTRTGESALIVSPTWGEVNRVNAEVRRTLQASNRIGSEEWSLAALRVFDLTEAQKRDARYYADDAVIAFNQSCRGIPKGDTGRLLAVLPDGVAVETADRVRIVPFAETGKFTVCRKEDMALCQGDRLQLKANARAVKGERLANGELVTVKRVEKSGRIQLEDGRILPPDYRRFVHGYAVTSYASQGKTVDHVLFSDAGAKAATNDGQWYVTISRGRRSVRIFTPDKEVLRKNVTRSGQRQLAMELTESMVKTLGKKRHSLRLLWDGIAQNRGLKFIREARKRRQESMREEKSRRENTRATPPDHRRRRGQSI
ncbi:MAG: MobF family relaxase [Luteolibacter sp.]